MSTKCQYQIAISKPKWWSLVKWYAMWRNKQTTKKIVPTKT